MIKKNGAKNGAEASLKALEENREATQFTSENQPPAEAKKEGWERKRAGQALMDAALKFMNMTFQEFLNLNLEEMTTADRISYQYVMQAVKEDKVMIDFFDRHVPKAPHTLALDEDSKPFGEILVKVILSNNEKIGNGSDDSVSEDGTSVGEIQDNLS